MTSRWWRAYDEALHDPKLMLLSDRLHRAWFGLMCIASLNEGVLPAIKVVAVQLRTNTQRAAAIITELHGAGLLDRREDGRYEPHNWNGRQYRSDVTDPTAANRQRDYRDRKRNADRNATVTRPVTVTPPRVQTTEADTDHLPSVGEARKRATRLPSDWKPDEKAIEYARMRGLTAHEIDVQAEKFRNYWLAKSGRSATKFDWDRTWQNWIIDTAEKLGRAALPAEAIQPVDLTPAQKDDWARGWRPGMPTSDEIRAHGGQNGAAEADRLEKTSPVDEGGERLRGEEPGLFRGGARH